MNFKPRLAKLEAMYPSAPWVPPIFFHSVVEPSENGPREFGAFAKIYVEGEELIVWRGDNEKHESFENRVMALEDLSPI